MLRIKQTIQALEVAGQHADGRPEHQRQQHGCEPDGERNASSGKHLREHVAPEVVGT